MLLLTLSLACREHEPDRSAGDLVLDDVHNYRADPSLALGAVKVMADADACVDWSALTLPEPATTVFLTEYRLLLGEVERQGAVGRVGNGDAAAWSARVAGRTEACLSDFQLDHPDPLGPPEFAQRAERTWVFTVPVGSCDIVGPAIVLRSSYRTTNLTATLDDTTSTLTVLPDLTVGAPLEGVAGTLPVLDWSGLADDGSGTPFNPRAGDRLHVAWFDETDIGALGDAVLDLEASADALYTTDVFGLTYVSLARAVDRDGALFEGFTTDGTWLVAIVSSDCARRPPRAAAVVSVTR